MDERIGRVSGVAMLLGNLNTNLTIVPSISRFTYKNA